MLRAIGIILLSIISRPEPSKYVFLTIKTLPRNRNRANRSIRILFVGREGHPNHEKNIKLVIFDQNKHATNDMFYKHFGADQNHVRRGKHMFF